MNKYHCYEVGTDNYICTLYTYTDVLNLQLFLQEKGTDLIVKPLKLSKKEVKKYLTPSKDTCSSSTNML